MLAALALTAHIPVIKPWPLRPAIEGGFILDDFTIDEATGTATSPNWLTRRSPPKAGARGATCSLRARCNGSVQEGKLVLHEDLARNVKTLPGANNSPACASTSRYPRCGHLRVPA
ncbi:hypothetical protein [Arthrobacter sp. MA-N2]|uniref:hypothetical protein n=1 Tax=Arthrobacter sp. MA-N2 TaxID=1101188 RepID=UPI0004B8ABD7|nr:hypothetical protein [Arthrobacter sp. MA-N2]